MSSQIASSIDCVQGIWSDGWLCLPGHYPLVDCIQPRLAETVCIHVLCPFMSSLSEVQPTPNKGTKEALSHPSERSLDQEYLYFPNRINFTTRILCPRRMLTWCIVMTVRSNSPACNVLDCRSHQQKWTGLVDLVCSYLLFFYVRVKVKVNIAMQWTLYTSRQRPGGHYLLAVSVWVDTIC